MTLSAGLTALLASGTVGQTAGPEFTYQGHLKQAGRPFNGNADFEFRLFDAEVGGTQIGSPVMLPGVPVAAGLFTVRVNEAGEFGSTAFNGDARWLEVSVNGTPLSPRQALTSAPYALALPGMRTKERPDSPNVLGGHKSNGPGNEHDPLGITIGGGGSGVDPQRANASYSTISGGLGNTAQGAYASIGGGLHNNVIYDNGTIAGGVENVSAGGSAFVGGGWDNIAAEAGVVAGGFHNRASFHAVVGGGDNNNASHPHGSIVGGYQNTAEIRGFVGGGNNNHAAGGNAFVGGGGGNYAYSEAAVAGGSNNHAGGQFAAIAGGTGNVADGAASAIPGGLGNSAMGTYSFAAGHQAKSLHNGTFVWDGELFSDFASTGEQQFLVRAYGGVGINTNAPAQGAALTVAGLTQTDGFRMTTGAAEGYVLTTDANGAGTWRPASGGVPNPLVLTGDQPGGAVILGKNTATGDLSAGVAGYATGPGGIGVYAQSDDPSSTGIWGRATAETGITTGVLGQTYSSEGRAVFGLALGSTGKTYGVFGRTLTDQGVGVRGEALADSGITYGGYFTSNSGDGVYGKTDSSATLAAGVRGMLNSNTPGALSAGVHGRVESTGDQGIGVYGVHAGDGWGVYGQTHGGRGVYGLASAGQGVGVYGASSSNAGYGGYFRNTGGVALKVEGGFDANSTATIGGELTVAGATTINDNLLVDGTATVDVLQITGADLAEKFPVSEDAQPGMLMAIDPQHPGNLCLARGAYNRCVAGVVSGANALPVGAVLGNLPGQQRTLPIALTGRVWVYCDATDLAIVPGDLLTTASRPGHAMKVADYPRAQGAIIGKAMTALENGTTGLVLVLVNLQ
ncbi:MAG: hypothetical protein C4547_02890 [Phycisphaerales bacterium]|nr:MAG: hypothetical protein C4547_02890 [Phycisphaerales bacterium]